MPTAEEQGQFRQLKENLSALVESKKNSGDISELSMYFQDLNRLGAKVSLLDAHRVYVEGPVKFKSAEMMSPPALRPAAIILVAMLGAPGVSVLKDVYSINRGYENLEERLKSIGAEIELKDDESSLEL